MVKQADAIATHHRQWFIFVSQVFLENRPLKGYPSTVGQQNPMLINFGTFASRMFNTEPMGAFVICLPATVVN